VLQPPGGSPNVTSFFENYLAAPVVIALYLIWKIKIRGAGGLFIRAHQMDLTTGMRQLDLEPLSEPKAPWYLWPRTFISGLI
jgi:amino acid transporter